MPPVPALAHLPLSQRRQVGALIDAPLAYPELTARENLEIAVRMRGAPATVVARAAALGAGEVGSPAVPALVSR